MNNLVLDVQGLTKTYEQGEISVEVLRQVNLQVQKGERHAIIGASGAGKSTLLHLLGGLDKVTGGHVEVMGKALDKLSEKQLGILRNKHLGFIYQFHHLLAEFSAIENIMMPLLIRREQREASRLGTRRGSFECSDRSGR